MSKKKIAIVFFILAYNLVVGQPYAVKEQYSQLLHANNWKIKLYFDKSEGQWLNIDLSLDTITPQQVDIYKYSRTENAIEDSEEMALIDWIFVSAMEGIKLDTNINKVVLTVKFSNHLQLMRGYCVEDKESFRRQSEMFISKLSKKNLIEFTTVMIWRGIPIPILKDTQTNNELAAPTLHKI
jgi:hypothetical protein